MCVDLEKKIVNSVVQQFNKHIYLCVYGVVCVCVCVFDEYIHIMICLYIYVLVVSFLTLYIMDIMCESPLIYMHICLVVKSGW